MRFLNTNEIFEQKLLMLQAEQQPFIEALVSLLSKSIPEKHIMNESGVLTPVYAQDIQERIDNYTIIIDSIAKKYFPN